MDAEAEEQQAIAIADAIAAGDASAEGLLYERYHPQLTLILRRRGADAMRAEDLAHEAYIVTLQRLRERALEEPALLGRFLKRTAINLWLNDVRKQVRHAEVGLDVAGELSNADAPDRDFEEARLSDVARELIGELTQERDRMVLVLTFVHDWDKQSICDYLELDSRTYDNVRSRAIKRCREIVKDTPLHRDAAEAALKDLEA